MDIRELLRELNMEADYKYAGGRLEFTQMGLCHIDTSQPCCSFVDSERYVDDIVSGSLIALTTAEIAEKHRELASVVVENPRMAFFTVHNLLMKRRDPGYCREDHETAVGAGCKISPMAHVSGKNVRIGNNVTIEEFVSVKERSLIQEAP